MQENIKESAELIEGRMTFVQEFLQKKYGFGILFFTLFLIAGAGCWWFYGQGKEEGRENSRLEIISFRAVRKNDSVSIEQLKKELIQKNVDLVSCQNELEKKQDFSQLKKTLQQKIEEADELNRIIRRETIPDNKKLNKNLKKIINQ
ncbi:hypothetical protein U9K52_09780 [Chryseobacterium sp. MHB01]|uniref:hypothetical protein n=1 Tax=Chryseobacterium sp. MHB01 TaxID=3109433 RepID=UPI002AFF2674|nr:hypothetical protein [Chryseobacterium sp. MHB01]MEA1849201.1 hypothetical protein [Chryseobacterium sp. MHB01]